MKTRKSKLPELNTGSMADIAFLLLIFFLVTATIPNIKGINRKLSRMCPFGQICDASINERNILRIQLNANDELFINENMTALSEVNELVMNFIENNGDTSCNYCSGLQLETASDNPLKDVISIETNSQSSYKQFIAVQDELTKAYYQLRIRYAKQKFNTYMYALTKAEIKQVKVAYSFIISEAITKPIN